jgi:hypothetical protein
MSGITHEEFMHFAQEVANEAIFTLSEALH